MALQIAIDRGGTFTDVWYKNKINGTTNTMKLLSEDPANYKDAPFEAIRRIVEKELNIKQSPKSQIDFSHIDWIRMGTTVATNALLERKGEPCVLVITKGFKDLLYIGNQARPDIFDLKINMPEMLYSRVVEVDERVLVMNSKCQLENIGKIEEGRHGEKVIIHKSLNESKVRRNLSMMQQMGFESLAVVLAHSYIYPKHEERIGQIAAELGFKQISLSSHVMPMIKMVPRGFTVTADAYLTPCIKKYINSFCRGFDGLNDRSKILFMQSDGGLADMHRFMGSRAVLSGPAGGVVGYAKTTFERSGGFPVVGFDMGGTSTDVSRYGGGEMGFEHVFESVTAGVPLQAPQLDINTVAAGGGSRLYFTSSEGMMAVGPQSAGAYPGPVCYRRTHGHLAVTDANLVLGRLMPHRFPKIFGENEDEPLDLMGARQAMIKITEEINNFTAATNPHHVPKSIYDIALGFIRIANEAMCRPIRSLTQARGYDTSRHVLACFGGAGGQHACAIARSLGMQRIFVHRYSGILSAYGLALADVVEEVQVPCSLNIRTEYKQIVNIFQNLCDKTISKLVGQGFLSPGTVQLKLFLNMRYDGTDCAMMIPLDNREDIENKEKHFYDSFINRYKAEFGFVLQNREIIVDDIRVRGSGLSGITPDDNATSLPNATTEPEEYTAVYFEDGWKTKTPVYVQSRLPVGSTISGPAVVVDSSSTVIVEPGFVFRLNQYGDLEIEFMEESANAKGTSAIGIEFDAVQLSIFSHRFMSIAEQMGKVLQRTSISTNIKERLDFSCAVFGPDGGLVANAPHIPVHLGAMQHTVQYQMGQTSTTGDPNKPVLGHHDVLLSNHPKTGGSHLPDLTVITPVFYDDIVGSSPIFFLANRGHHADIGGTTPGSMPPQSNTIFEEGAVFKTFFLVKDGVFQEKEVIEALQKPAEYPGCSGSRNIPDNISDLRAQVAANEKGRRLVMDLITEYGLTVVQAYMKHIQDNAELAVRNMLREIGIKNKISDETDDIVELLAHDYMDSGSKLNLKVKIDTKEGSAVFDFTGSAIETITNLNTPPAVTNSCLIYCLRCMVGHDVPLNQGCLKPIKLIIPKNSILSPHDNSAVVGGNVQTSQRIVDVILRAFNACAGSQGCMNNVTFGDGESGGYYETIGGGAGAGPNWSGRSGVHTHMTNTRITDLEILETRYPVILTKFGLRTSSGGVGQFKGGDGICRNIKFRSPLTLSLLTERRVFHPFGLNGGDVGKRGENLLYCVEGERLVDLGGKTSVQVKPGDELRIRTPGGGGFGERKSIAITRMSMDNQSNEVPQNVLRGSWKDYENKQFSA